MLLKPWTKTIIVAAVALAPQPHAAALQAAPLRADFSAMICRAMPPVVSHAWANGIHVAEAGAVIRAADSSISNADHAEILFKIGLLEGHLMVGRELIQAGQPRLALPHFGHPVRELYDDIARALPRRGLTAFDGELIALEALAAGKPGDAAFVAQYDKAIRILGAVRATVPAGLLDNDGFMLGVLGEVATVASEDYGESIEGGRIEKPVEYHDSRGYLAYASQELRRLESRTGMQGSARLAAARARLTEMQAIVGPLIPPERPLTSVAAYKAIVAQFKQAAATGA